MAIRTKDELIGMIRGRIGEDTSDEALALLEDLTDTMDDFENRVTDPENWKEKYTQLDADWRKRYRDRFSDSSVGEVEERKTGSDPETILTYEDLFKTE